MHTHISAIAAFGTLAAIVSTLGIANLVARRFPDSSASQGWQLLMSPVG